MVSIQSHRNGDEMGMVYIGRILRYIGLIWFDDVWCHLLSFWCRNSSYSLGLGRMTISWPTWTLVLWSWPSTTGRSLGKRGPSIQNHQGNRSERLNDPEWWHSSETCETHAEIEMLLKFKTIDFVDLSCNNHFSLSEDSRSPAMGTRLTPMISLCTVAISSQWFLKSDASQCYIPTPAQKQETMCPLTLAASDSPCFNSSLAMTLIGSFTWDFWMIFGVFLATN